MWGCLNLHTCVFSGGESGFLHTRIPVVFGLPAEFDQSAFLSGVLGDGVTWDCTGENAEFLKEAAPSHMEGTIWRCSRERFRGCASAHVSSVWQGSKSQNVMEPWQAFACAGLMEACEDEHEKENAPQVLAPCQEGTLECLAEFVRIDNSQ